MIIPTTCPFCQCNLEGEAIKLEERALVNTSSEKWGRVQLMVRNNRVEAFGCPDCKKEWPIHWMVQHPPAVDME
jgi:hypothetical protein